MIEPQLLQNSFASSHGSLAYRVSVVVLCAFISGLKSMNTQQMAKEIHSAIVPLIAKIYWSVSLASGGITSLRMKEDKKEKILQNMYTVCIPGRGGERERRKRV